MDDFEEENTVGGEGRGAKVLHTDRPSDEAGPRGAFAPRNRKPRTHKTKILIYLLLGQGVLG